MKKTKVLVFVLLAFASLMLHIVLSMGKPDGQSKRCCPSSLDFYSNNPAENRMGDGR